MRVLGVFEGFYEGFGVFLKGFMRVLGVFEGFYEGFGGF